MKVKPEQTNQRTRSDKFAFLSCGYRNTEGATLRSVNRKSGSSKEGRYYTTRGSAAMDDNGKVSVGGGGGGGGDERGLVWVWPKFYISLSNKAKEEDFIMAMN